MRRADMSKAARKNNLRAKLTAIMLLPVAAATIAGPAAARSATARSAALGLASSGPTDSSAIEFRDSPFFHFEFEGNFTADITLADVDGDGDVDALTANGRHWAQRDWVYLNDGSGRMLAAKPIGDGRGASYTVQALDLDHDGDLDAVVVRDRLPAQIYLNDASGTFTFAGTVNGTGGAARGATVFDANGDGNADLIIYRRRGGCLLLIGGGDGGFSEIRQITADGHGATGGAVTDLDGDGDIDVAIARRDGNLSIILENDGTGAFTAHAISGSTGDHRKTVIADFDGDTKPDLALADTDGRILLYAGQGSIKFQQPTTIKLGGDPVQSLAAADLDMDGDIDIVAGAELANVLLTNEGGLRFAESRLPGGESDTYGVSIGDMTGNGRPDIVVANSGDGNIILRNFVQK